MAELKERLGAAQKKLAQQQMILDTYTNQIPQLDAKIDTSKAELAKLQRSHEEKTIKV